MSLRELNSTNYKKYKRATNAFIKELNQSIKNDWLWNGRFIMSQESSYFQAYEDHSGGCYTVYVAFTDIKTGRKEYNQFDNYNIDWKMLAWANYCITEIWKVWNENPNPHDQAKLEGRYPNILK